MHYVDGITFTGHKNAFDYKQLLPLILHNLYSHKINVDNRMNNCETGNIYRDVCVSEMSGHGLYLVRTIKSN